MRTLFTFVAMVSAVLVPWSSLAPALLPDASGSAISNDPSGLHLLAARLNPALGILPLTTRDDLGEPDEQPANAQPDFAANPPARRLVCENGVCRLVDDPDHLPPYAVTPLDPTRRKLESMGATQIRLELDAEAEWRCICSVPVHRGSTVMRKFEATGASDAQAVEEACRRIETWLQEHH